MDNSPLQTILWRLSLNILRSTQKWPTFCTHHLQIYFLKWNAILLEFDWISFPSVLLAINMHWYMQNHPRWYSAKAGHQRIRWSTINWGRVTHICAGNLTITGSDNGLLPGRHQAIIWTIARILFIGTLRTNLGEILIKIHVATYRWLKLSA